MTEEIKRFTGGALGTHAYVLPGNDQRGTLLFDAPEGIADYLEREALSPAALLLTHGHFDHIWDAAVVARRYQCPVYIHSHDALMLKDPTTLFRPWLFGATIEAVEEFRTIDLPDEGESVLELEGWQFRLFHIPGHSPGSVAFYWVDAGTVIGGDVLFAGGIGRWDFPGGSLQQLVQGIHRHLLPLPADTQVLPGHGPPTTVGQEADTNSYLTMSVPK